MAVRKVYKTKIRTEISEYFKQNHSRTLSAADIKAFLNEKDIEVNNTTIYRYLDKLCAEETIMKYPDAEGEKAVYQYTGDGHHCTEHLHLKCISCGRIFHLDSAFMDEFKEYLLNDYGFHIQCSGDLLHGICDECRKKRNES